MIFGMTTALRPTVEMMIIKNNCLFVTLFVKDSSRNSRFY